MMLVSGMTALALAWTVPVEASAQQAAKAAPSMVFDGATVVDVEHGTLVPDQRVVIVGTHIQAVGAAKALKLPPGAQVVDARGKYLIPGLWDMHVHPRNDAHLFYPLFVANGVTGIRDAGSPIPLDSLRQWRREILAGSRLGPPRQILSGPAIEKGGEPMDTATARLLVDSLVAAGADMLKFREMRPPSYFALAAAARRRGILFGGHADGPDMMGQALDLDSPDFLNNLARGRAMTPRLVPSPGVSALEASDSGALLIDHTLGNDRTIGERHCWGAADTTSREQCQRETQRFLHNGTWLVQTEIAYLAYLGNRATTWGAGPRAEALLQQLNERARQFWADSLPAGHWLHDPAGADTARQAPGPAHTAAPLAGPQQLGLPLLSGSDVDANVSRRFIHGLAGFSLHGSLAIAVAEGLTPLLALQTATLNPARAFRLTDSLGTVAAGKLADLVLLDANPLADITNTTAIRAVVANGRYFDRSTLDSLLMAVRAERP